MMKNVFYFTSKALSILKIVKFLSFFMRFWSCRKNSLIRKITLISKSMTSQPEYQTIATHILPNISDNQAMKFGQLIEYKIRNIFIEKSCTKYAAETIPRPSS